MAEIDRWMFFYDKPELSIMEYVASDLVLGHVDWWISATFSPFLIYYILYYNLSINCTQWECTCDLPFCGNDKYDNHDDFEYEYPSLDKKCAPGSCDCDQIFCQIAEHDIKVETKEDAMDDIALECNVVDQNLRWEVVVDQYLRMR